MASHITFISSLRFPPQCANFRWGVTLQLVSLCATVVSINRIRVCTLSSHQDLVSWRIDNASRVLAGIIENPRHLCYHCLLRCESTFFHFEFEFEFETGDTDVHNSNYLARGLPQATYRQISNASACCLECRRNSWGRPRQQQDSSACARQRLVVMWVIFLVKQLKGVNIEWKILQCSTFFSAVGLLMVGYLVGFSCPGTTSIMNNVKLEAQKWIGSLSEHTCLRTQLTSHTWAARVGRNRVPIR